MEQTVEQHGAISTVMIQSVEVFTFEEALDKKGVLYHLATQVPTPIPTPPTASSPPSPLLLMVMNGMAARLGLCRAPVMMVSTIAPATRQTRGWRWISSATSPPLTTASALALTTAITNYATGGWKAPPGRNLMCGGMEVYGRLGAEELT